MSGGNYFCHDFLGAYGSSLQNMFQWHMDYFEFSYLRSSQCKGHFDPPFCPPKIKKSLM